MAMSQAATTAANALRAVGARHHFRPFTDHLTLDETMDALARGTGRAPGAAAGGPAGARG